MRTLFTIFFLALVACTHASAPSDEILLVQESRARSYECFDDRGCGFGDYCCDNVCQAIRCQEDPEPTCSSTWQECGSDDDCCDGLICKRADGIDVCMW